MELRRNERRSSVGLKLFLLRTDGLPQSHCCPNCMISYMPFVTWKEQKVIYFSRNLTHTWKYFLDLGSLFSAEKG
jgi:hypothetical protein